MTTRVKNDLPTHVAISTMTGIRFDSVALVEQITSVDTYSLIKKLGMCNSVTMSEIDNCILIQSGVKIEADNKGVA